MIEKLEQIVSTQVEAIKNLKIDKVTVWDNGGKGKDGKTSTADFLSGLYGSVPPLDEVFKMAGLELPTYLKGESKDEKPVKKITVTPNKPSPKSKPNPPSAKGPESV